AHANGAAACCRGRRTGGRLGGGFVGRFVGFGGRRFGFFGGFGGLGGLCRGGLGLSSRRRFRVRCGRGLSGRLGCIGRSRRRCGLRCTALHYRCGQRFVRDVNIHFVCDEAAHRTDIVFRRGGIQPEGERATTALLMQDLAHETHLDAQGLDIFLVELRDFKFHGQAGGRAAGGRTCRLHLKLRSGLGSGLGGGGLGGGGLHRRRRRGGSRRRRGCGRRGAMALLCQRAQLFTDTLVRFAAGLLLVAVGGNLIGQHVFGLEKEVYHVFAKRHLATTNGGEKACKQMRCVGQHAEA